MPCERLLLSCASSSGWLAGPGGTTIISSWCCGPRYDQVYWSHDLRVLRAVEGVGEQSPIQDSRLSQVVQFALSLNQVLASGERHLCRS